MTVAPHPFDAVTLEELRARRSAKWTFYPDDVLPAWVAEMDFPLAEPIRRALREAIDRDDCGYASATGLARAFAAWTERSWGLRPREDDVHLVADVVTGIAEILRVATAPGDRVVVDPPVYFPFAGTIRTLGRVVAEAPLARDGARFVLDLDAIERAYRDGARVHLLCHPQNPTGVVYSRAELAALGELAARHGVLVLSDEIHAPLTLPGATHVPFAVASAAGASRCVLLTSASKTWNVAGLKAAMLVACGDEPRAVLARLPPDLPFHAGHLGVVAARAAFEEGEPWREQAVAALDRNRRLLADLLAEHLPEARYVPPEASYLAWLDLRALGLGDDPARVLLERGRVALSGGPMFGAQGIGHARLNIATTASILEALVHRMAKAVA